VQLIIYEPVKADPKAFIEFWTARYTGYDDDFYHANVGHELSEARILELFEWRTVRGCPDRNGILWQEILWNGAVNSIRYDGTKQHQRFSHASAKVARSLGSFGFIAGSPRAFPSTISTFTGRCGS
jgi:hypothetical protein